MNSALNIALIIAFSSAGKRTTHQYSYIWNKQRRGEKFFHRARSRFHYYRGTYHQPNFEKQKKNKKFPITIILSPILLISYLLLITKRNPFDRSQMNVHLQNYNFKTLKKCIKLFSRQQTTSSLVLSNFMKKFISNFHFFMLIFFIGAQRNVFYSI